MDKLHFQIVPSRLLLPHLLSWNETNWLKALRQAFHSLLIWGDAMKLCVGKRILTTILFICALVVILTPEATVNAQMKYKPEHPDVRRMCDAAASYLNFATRDNKRGALSALAVLQYYKRYEQRVPKDNEYIKSVVENIAAAFPGPGFDYEEARENENILVQTEIYYPCLAMILLAEYDSKKYKPEIKQFLNMLKRRQRPNGAFTYRSQPNSGDTSQTQFAALAMSVAKTHGFNVDIEMAKKTLDWLCVSQQGGGQWIYKLVYGNGSTGAGRPDPSSRNNNPSPSMQAAGLGSCYLLADFLQLNKRAKSMSKAMAKDIGLPRTVTIYVKPIDGEGALRNKTGPLTNFDRGKLNSATRSGNTAMISMFTPKARRWNYYHLYAVERYAYFREQTEGDMRGLEDWYDQVIDQMKQDQKDDGSFPTDDLEVTVDATAFALLFMVRSSEVINLPITAGEARGGRGFETDTILVQDRNGGVTSVDAEKNLGDLLSMLKDGATDEQMQQLSASLKKQIVEFRKKDDKDRGQIKAFLRSMIGAKNYYRRLIAVRFLAGEQDMDNAPALIYALGDPDFRIAIEAHNGLRLISRKIDSLKVSSLTEKNAVRPPGVLKEKEKNGLVIEFAGLKEKWTEWLLKIRPGAELLD